MSEPDQASWLDELDLDATHSWRVMGTRSLGHRPWLSGGGDAGCDAVRQLLGLRSELLRERFDEVCVAPASAGPAVRELVRLVADEAELTPPAGSDQPGSDQAGSDQAGPGQAGTDQAGTDPADLLGWLGRSVVEDFCLLRRDDREWVLEAGVVCFPSRWRLVDKLGLPLRSVHEPVDGYDPVLADRVTSLLDRLDDRIVLRRNWFVHPNPDLHQPDRPAEGDPIVAAGDVLDGLHLRSERQTLRRLPESDRVVFAITTRQCPLRTLVADDDRRARFVDCLRRAPADQLAHRGMAPEQVAVALDALESRSGEPSRQN